MAKILLMLVIVILLLSLIGACKSTSIPQITASPQMKSIKIRVLDAESNQPIANATIHLHYFPSTPESADPKHPQYVSNAQGEVLLSSEGKPTIWQVQATDYIEQRSVTNDGTLPYQFSTNSAPGVDGVIYLYHMPEPQVSIQIPHNYTGLLTINLHPAEGFAFVKFDGMNDVFVAVDTLAKHAQGLTGQRYFTITTSANGIGDMVVTPLLYNIQSKQVQVQEDNKLLPHRDFSNLNETERGVWGNVNEDDKRGNHQFHLFVGTRKEYMASQQ